MLEFDPRLHTGLRADQRELAGRILHVDVIRLEVGPWQVPPFEETLSFGLLIGSGILLRQLHLAGSSGLEPLGPGDLVRPWQSDATSFAESEFRAVTPAQVAVLDRDFAMRAAQYPSVIANLIERATLRSRYLAIYAALCGQVGLRNRLLTLMWTLAERWGERRSGEVFIPLDFSHSTLAQLVAARRPSVTVALGELQREGLLDRVKTGWVVRGEPPAARSTPGS